MVRPTRDRQYKWGDTVSVCDYRSEHDNWIPGVIHRKTGPVLYQVEVSPDTYWRRHSDQIQSSDWSRPGETSHDIPVSGGVSPSPEPPPLPIVQETATQPPVVKTPVKSATPPKERRYPIQARKKPEKLDI